jgi:dihydrofolate reductase
MRMGHLDELRLLINPIVLSEGQTLFKTSDQRTALMLVKTKTFGSGGILAYYQPVSAQSVAAAGRRSLRGGRPPP